MPVVKSTRLKTTRIHFFSVKSYPLQRPIFSSSPRVSSHELGLLYSLTSEAAPCEKSLALGQQINLAVLFEAAKTGAEPCHSPALCFWFE